MEIGTGVIDFIPGEPVRVGCFVCAFVKVGSPLNARGGCGCSGIVFGEQREGEPIFDRPGGGLSDFGLDDFRLGMGDFDLIEIVVGEFGGRLAGGVLEVEEHSAAAIGFEIEETRWCLSRWE